MTPPRIESTPTPSLFRMEWLVPVDSRSQVVLTRAVAEKADAILRGAQFVGDASDHEVRVWVDGAAESACLSIVFEPGARAHGFYLLDESLTERLACVVFEDLRCIGAEESERQLDALLDAVRRASPTAPAAEPTVRVRVRDAKRDG